ncbi:MAG: NAD(P)-binding protein, partial [Opitutae bacterium]|nr:NAD(P)-binding protein [Opitutae bacterium]
MKVGIVGSGISGLICAYLLRNNCDVTLYESDTKAGGHVNTVEVKEGSNTHKIDTGFIV